MIDQARVLRPIRLLAVVAISAVLAANSALVLAGAPQVRIQAAGYYRIVLGDFEVTALLDGTHPLPVDEVMLNAAPGEVSKLLARSDIKRPVEGSINAFLVNTGKKLILIDSGAGILYGPCCGRLIGNLRASGYAPEQVDEVYLTHLHRDHVGGVDAKGAMAFPNAIVRVSKVDADYWLNRDNEKTAPSYLGTMFDGAIDSLKPYIAAGRLRTFDSDAELTPGIHPIPSPGHTPGHTWYVVESCGQKMVVWGDVVHVAPVQFAEPGIRLKYDSDAMSAEKERRLILAEAAAQGYLVAAAHISYPGLGHVIVVDHHYEWAPAQYTTWLTPTSP